MTVFIDIGSTCIKFFDDESGVSIYQDRDPIYPLAQQVMQLLAVTPTNKPCSYRVSSSANGGLKVVLFTLTRSISGQAAYDCISSSGGNIIQHHVGLDELSIDSNLAYTADLYIIVAGTNEYITFNLKDRIISLLRTLINSNIPASKILCSSCLVELPSELCQVRLIQSVFNSRLVPTTAVLAQYISSAYLTDIISTKDLDNLPDTLKCAIKPTPDVVHSGFTKHTIGGPSSFGFGTRNTICLDVGGATTDIYYPRLSLTNQDGINIDTNSTSRWVLVSIGFHHSQKNTIVTAKRSYWYQDFALNTPTPAVESEKSFIVCLCILIALLNACKDGELDFNYPINFKAIDSIYITGGGSFALRPIDKDFLASFIQTKLATALPVTYDQEYHFWRKGHTTF